MSNWIHLILILGAAQGFFLTVLIFNRRSVLYANRFLGAIIFFYSIILLHLVLDETGFYDPLVLLKYSVETLPFLISPLHYLYARALIHDKKYRSIILFRHALPAISYFLFRIIYLLMDIHLSHPQGRSTDYIIYNWAINIQGLSYMTFTLLLIHKYDQALVDMFSALEKVKLTWLRNITLVMTFLLIIFFTENSLFLFDVNFSNFFNLSSTMMAVSVYAMGYMGLSRSEVFLSGEIAEPMHQIPKMEEENRLRAYEKSGLSDQKAEQFQQQLLNLMEQEQLFRDSNLTLSKVAGKLNISTHNLSEVINKRLNKNFFDFINSYRVQQVKNDLADQQKNNLTLIAIAFDAGFNSKSSFNAIFKKHTGKTPSEYRQ